MIILGIRTDKPEAELYVYQDSKKITEHKWQAHLKLAETLNAEIDKILNCSSISYKDLQGVVVFEGPGSFTGLRIGISVANALAYSLNIPVVATSGGQWLIQGTDSLRNAKKGTIALPVYGAPVHITKPKK